MKLNVLILPALTLLGGAVAENLGDCEWLSYAFTSPDLTKAYSLHLQSLCPPPKKEGDVFTSSTLDLNHCVGKDSRGNIQPLKDGHAFKSISPRECMVDSAKKTLHCKGHGNLPVADIVKYHDKSFECYGHKAEAVTSTSTRPATARTKATATATATGS